MLETCVDFGTSIQESVEKLVIALDVVTDPCEVLEKLRPWRQ